MIGHRRHDSGPLLFPRRSDWLFGLNGLFRATILLRSSTLSTTPPSCSRWLLRPVSTAGRDSSTAWIVLQTPLLRAAQLSTWHTPSSPSPRLVNLAHPHYSSAGCCPRPLPTPEPPASLYLASRSSISTISRQNGQALQKKLLERARLLNSLYLNATSPSSQHQRYFPHCITISLLGSSTYICWTCC